MRYGYGIGTGPGLLWGLVAIVAGLIGLAFPVVLVAIALALAVRALLWVRRAGGTSTLGKYGTNGTA